MRLSHEGSTVEQPLAVRPVRLTHLFLAPAAAKGSAADRRLGPAGRGIRGPAPHLQGACETKRRDLVAANRGLRPRTGY